MFDAKNCPFLPQETLFTAFCRECRENFNIRVLKTKFWVKSACEDAPQVVPAWSAPTKMLSHLLHFPNCKMQKCVDLIVKILSCTISDRTDLSPENWSDTVGSKMSRENSPVFHLMLLQFDYHLMLLQFILLSCPFAHCMEVVNLFVVTLVVNMFVWGLVVVT